MSEPERNLTELDYLILDAMADDAENIEQIYLWINTEGQGERRFKSNYLLHILIDELIQLMKDGYVEPRYSNNEKLAPLSSFNPAAVHHYWFAPTEKGHRAWQQWVE